MPPERHETQPSAEIVYVEGAKRRRQGDESHVRAYLGSWKMRTGDLLVSTTVVRGVAGEVEAENWRLCSTTLVRGVAGELEAENFSRGPICGAGS